MTKIQTLKGLPRPLQTLLYVDGTNLLAGLVELFGYENVPNFSSILKEIKKCFMALVDYKNNFLATDIQSKITNKLKVVKIKAPALKARVRLKL